MAQGMTATQFTLGLRLQYLYTNTVFFKQHSTGEHISGFRMTATSLVTHEKMANEPAVLLGISIDFFELTFHVCISRFSAVRHSSVVMSWTSVLTFGIGRIGNRSTPRIMLPRGMYFAATWHHPPGAAHRSMQTFAELRISYFLFICVGCRDN